MELSKHCLPTDKVCVYMCQTNLIAQLNIVVLSCFMGQHLCLCVCLFGPRVRMLSSEI